MNPLLEQLSDKDIDRAERYFREAVKRDLQTELFSPLDKMMFNINKKLVSFSKKELIQEVLRRKELRRKKAIIDKLKSLGDETVININDI